MVARPWSSSRLSCGERLLLRCDGNAGNSSRPRRERIPPPKLGGRNGLLWMWAGLSCFLPRGDGYVGELLELQQGFDAPFGSSRGYMDLPRPASAEIGLISPGGENLLDFLELRQVLSTSDGDLRYPLWWPQERPVPMRVSGASRDSSPLDAVA